jgi:hypothetical protein
LPCFFSSNSAPFAQAIISTMAGAMRFGGARVKTLNVPGWELVYL